MSYKFFADSHPMASTKIIAIGASLVAFGVLLGGGCWYWGRESSSEPAAPAEASPADASAVSSSTSSAGKQQLDLVPSFELRAPAGKSSSSSEQNAACEVLVGILEMLGELLARGYDEYWNNCSAFIDLISSKKEYSALDAFIRSPEIGTDFQPIKDEVLRLTEEPIFKTLRNSFADDQKSNIFIFTCCTDFAKFTRQRTLKLLASDENTEGASPEQAMAILAKSIVLYSIICKISAGNNTPHYVERLTPVAFDELQDDAFKYIDSELHNFKYATKRVSGEDVMNALAVANVSDPKVLKSTSIEEATGFCNSAGAINILLAYCMLWESENSTDRVGLAMLKKNAWDDSSYWTDVMQLAGASSEAQLIPSKVMAMRATRPKLLATMVELAMRCYQQARRARYSASKTKFHVQ
ncbi:hypothetical protein PAPHI01_1726 [Pancytospora philotis]|nr:hypothetical protein PAPHI01_1726 [Pancytospora philotis]